MNLADSWFIPTYLDKNIETMKTSPRKRSIRKLFTILSDSLFGSARPYSEEFLLTFWLKYFTLASSPASNRIYSVLEVLSTDLFFVYTNIVQRPETLST